MIIGWINRAVWPGLIQSVSQAFLAWLRPWFEVGGLASFLCSKALLLPQLDLISCGGMSMSPRDVAGQRSQGSAQRGRSAEIRPPETSKP